MSTFIGYLHVGGAALLWGSAGLVGAIASDIPASLLAALRTLFGSIALCLFIGPDAIRALNLRSSWPMLMMTTACLALFQWSFFASVELVGASIASIVSTAVAPLAADGIALLRQGVAPSRRWWMSALFCSVGLLLPVLKGEALWGTAAAAVAGTSYGIYTLAAARLERTSSNMEGAGITATALAFAGATSALMPAVRSHLGLIFSVRVLLVALYLGLVTTALAYALYLRSLRDIAPGSALSAACTQPFAVMVLAEVVLHEHLDRFAWATAEYSASQCWCRSVCRICCGRNRNTSRLGPRLLSLSTRLEKELSCLIRCAAL